MFKSTAWIVKLSASSGFFVVNCGLGGGVASQFRSFPISLQSFIGKLFSSILR